MSEANDFGKMSLGEIWARRVEDYEKWWKITPLWMGQPGDPYPTLDKITLASCRKCGSVVLDMEAHKKWHEQFVEKLEVVHTSEEDWPYEFPEVNDD